MIGQEVSHYRILERLGGGGMGVVYKAEDTSLGRTVALKFLSAELLSNEPLRRRFLHEARAASQIDHPNVCHVYEVGESDGRTFMAMSFCEGRSLRDVIADGRVPPREAFSIAFGIAQGLWAAHRRGIVHRDIKPGNVMITGDGYVKIVDFGLARLTGQSHVTTSGVTVGTVAYMSPEQTTDGRVSANTDIWSLGVTLYEMLTGRFPFRGQVNAAIQYSIVNEPHIPLLEANSSVPPECARIIDRCLEKDPTKRYQTVGELLQDIVLVARELGWESSIASSTIEPIIDDARRRTRMRRIGVVAATVVLAAGGWWAWRHLHGPPSPYVTKVRLAVMPLENLIGVDNEALVDGLGDHIARVARWVGRGNESMWTTPYAVVMEAQLPDPKSSLRAFGANRMIVGNVQRVGTDPHVQLELRDVSSGDVLHKVSMRLAIDSSTAFMDSLPLVLAEWFDVNPRALPGTPWRVREARATRPYLEGLSYHRKGTRNRDASAFLANSVEADTTFAFAAYAAANAELARYPGDHNAERLARAVRDGRLARRHAPSLPEASMVLGNAFRLLERPDSAEACYRYASKVDSKSFPAYERLGNLYSSENRLEESEEAYLRATKALPDYWVAQRFLGEFYYDQQRLNDAEQAWEKALTLAPDDILSLNDIGVVYYHLNQWPRAQEIFLRSFRVHPDCNSCNNVATSLFLDGKYKEASSYFELALSPEYCDSTYSALGNLASALYWVEGSRPRSLALYQRAIAIASAELVENPDSPKLIARLVDYYAMSGDSVRAREMMTRAEPFLDENTDVMYRVGSALEKLGDRQAAIHHLGNAVRHGYALLFIERDPVLRELVTDPVFVEMTRTDETAEGARAANNKH